MVSVSDSAKIYILIEGHTEIEDSPFAAVILGSHRLNIKLLTGYDQMKIDPWLSVV